jgi:hypothetical protein
MITPDCSEARSIWREADMIGMADLTSHPSFRQLCIFQVQCAGRRSVPKAAYRRGSASRGPDLMSA